MKVLRWIFGSDRIMNLTVKVIMGVIVLGIAYFFLSGKDYSVNQNENSHKFGASYMTMNNPFYSVVNEEIQAAVEANGDVLIVRDPQLDPEKQKEQIFDLIDEGVEAIFITPVDYKDIMPAIQAARSRGIKIISVDTEMYDESLADCSVVSDNYDAGVKCAEYLMEKKESGSILLLEHGTAQSGIDRIKGFSDAIKENENFKIVATKQCLGQLEIAMPVVQDVIDEGIEFDVIFALNDPAALGAMAALQENNLMDKVSVLGVDGSPEAKSMIKENIMLASSAQFPTKIGQVCGELLYKVIEGEEYSEKNIIPVELITAENADSFSIDDWQ